MPGQLVPVRKTHAGSVSGGYTWPADGAVVMVPYDLALELTRIRDGGFSVVEPDDLPAEVTEPAPAGEASVTEPAPRRTARRPPVTE
jgi:CubicO group peptidase (beta-lactamase class C family)